MELKPKEKIKIENYKAQYNSILGNISSSNRELEKTLNETRITKQKLSDLTKELTDKQKELSTLFSIQKEKVKQLDDREIILQKREEKVSKKENKLIDEANKKLSKMRFFSISTS